MPSIKSLPSLSSAMEDYLEAIYHLEKERRIARVRDIAKKLGVKMSSVTSALKSLSSRGLIKYDPHQYITLTDHGIAKAEEIVRKHDILKRFLSRVLKVEESVAEDNACSMEHHLDPEVVEKLVGFLEFAEMCPVDQTRWSEGLVKSCDDCLHCLDQAKKKVRNRVKAQEAAVREGMTLSGAEPGSRVMIDSVKGPAKFRKLMSKEGVQDGAIAEIETKDADSGALHLTIKGYRVSLEAVDASKIFVKPF